MVSALAFGWADNTYPNLDYSGYHKNVIQLLFIIFTFQNQLLRIGIINFNAAHFCHRYRMQIHVFYGSWFYKESQENLHLPTVDKRDGVKASFGLE